IEKKTKKTEQNEVHNQGIKKITDDLLTTDMTLFAEMLTENYHTAPIEVIALVNQQKAYIIDIQNAVQSSSFKAWAEDSTQKKSVFDAKATRVAFLHEGINLKGIDF